MGISERVKAFWTKRNMLASLSQTHTLFPSSFLALNITRLLPSPSQKKDGTTISEHIHGIEIQQSRETSGELHPFKHTLPTTRP